MVRKIPLLLSILTFLVVPFWAEARFGGGATFGSRGSRSVAPRSFGGGSGYGAPRSNYAPRPVSPQPIAPPPLSSYPPMGYQGGGFFRNMMGGMAGGFLGSMLFRSLGFGGMGGMPAQGGGGFGLLEILLIGGILYFVFKTVLSRAALGPGPVSGPGQQTAQTTEQSYYGGGFGQTRNLNMMNQDEPSSEDTIADIIRRYDGGFDPRRFKDSKVDEFFQIQAAWMQRDLSAIQPLVSTDIAAQLEKEVGELKSTCRVNHVENVAVRETQLVEAWQEVGKDYVTMRFYANLVDYTVDERTGQVVAGDKIHAVKFEEFWTYSREVGRPDCPWVLTAIEQQQ